MSWSSNKQQTLFYSVFGASHSKDALCAPHMLMNSLHLYLELDMLKMHGIQHAAFIDICRKRWSVYTTANLSLLQKEKKSYEIVCSPHGSILCACIMWCGLFIECGVA